jgi:hypothetical protein
MVFKILGHFMFKRDVTTMCSRVFFIPMVRLYLTADFDSGEFRIHDHGTGFTAVRLVNRDAYCS